MPSASSCIDFYRYSGTSKRFRSNYGPWLQLEVKLIPGRLNRGLTCIRELHSLCLTVCSVENRNPRGLLLSH
jgi:hypothetical protein